MIIAGKYRLVQFLARGGMAEVWRATHAELRSEVAIKVVDPRLTSDSTTAPYALERFRFEAQISARLASLTHHVVAVHDAGEHEGLPFLVMEYVPGITLEEELSRRGPLTPERMAVVLEQAADALGAAHSLGIVHRDIKPSNLMLVTAEGRDLIVKVADFGVAKALARNMSLDRPRETAVGQLVGTPAYMSPEQLRSPEDIDARTDVWSLGVLAYEALTGSPAFPGATLADLMAGIIGRDAAPASKVRKDLPRTLDAWFSRVLAKDPESRFPSAREAAAAFRAALAAAPRRRAGWFAAGAIALAAAAIAITALFVQARAPANAAPASPTATAAATAAAATVTAAPEPPPSAEPAVTVTPAPAKPAHEPSPKHAPAPPPSAPPPTTAATATATAATATIEPATAATATAAPTTTAPPPRKKRIDPSEIQ